MTRFYAISFLAALLLLVVEPSSQVDTQKLLKKKLKQEKHKVTSHKSSICDNLKRKWDPIVVRQSFMPTTIIESVPLSSKNTPHYYYHSIHSEVEKFYETYTQQCSHNNSLSSNSTNSTMLNATIVTSQSDIESFKRFRDNLLNLTWRYQFFESERCIIIELDLGFNLTRLSRLAPDFKYYTFSYRPLSEQNVYLSRQPVNESKNTLTIRNVQLKPYVVCVSFYRNGPEIFLQQQSAPASKAVKISGGVGGGSDTNIIIDDSTSPAISTNEISCQDYLTTFAQDLQFHDLDMCIDIDVHSHFLGDLSHDFHGVDSEFIMVLFIMFLLFVILGAIALIHHVIEIPRKRAALSNLYNYLKRKNQQSHPSTAALAAADTTSFISKDGGAGSTTRHQSASKLQAPPSHGSGLFQSTASSASGHSPAITVTDYSQDGSIVNRKSSQEFQVSKEDLQGQAVMPEEVEPLISSPPSSDGGGPLSGKVRFHIGETIPEEPSNENLAKKDEHKQALIAVTADTLQHLPAPPPGPSPEEAESLQTLSHLLDDKPWLH